MYNENEDWYDYEPEIRSRNINAPDGVHIMNKDEAKELRRLRAETGMGEVELRTHKRYRVLLSEAQKKGEIAKRTYHQKVLDRIMKSVTKELKLAKEHPKVVALYKARLKEQRLDHWSSYYRNYNY
jgi:hypothetical protein